MSQYLLLFNKLNLNKYILISIYKVKCLFVDMKNFILNYSLCFLFFSFLFFFLCVFDVNVN